MTMKKLLRLSPSRIFVVCGLGLALTLGAFWHQQSNQVQVDRMNVLNQGMGTCFNRISQTFTAMMIKDIQSPYLHQGFMALSDECLSETIKGINPFRQNVGKGYEALSRLMSDVHWFHESVVKLHTPMIAGKNLDAPLSPLSERYSKMETIKTELLDAVDSNSAKLREIQKNDEILMGVGMIIFVIALSLLSLQEFNRIQLQREIEKQALNLLKAGQANVGAIVDQLVERALVSQNMPVTSQIFRDYHGQILERMVGRNSTDKTPVQAAQKVEATPVVETQEHTYVVPKVQVSEEITEAEMNALAEAQAALPKSSLKETLVSIQKQHGKENIQISDIRDVQLRVETEALEQMLNAAVSKMLAQKSDNKRIMVSNQIHADKSVINLFLGNAMFRASELEFAGTTGIVAGNEIDMNLVLMKEMADEAGVTFHIENKADKNGNVAGMTIRFVANRVPKEARAKNLISVMKGKKRDLTRELAN